MDKKENDFQFYTGFNSSLSFPAEFPYEFDSFDSFSDVGSPVESTEMESCDQDNFLAGLTRHLTQQLVGEPNYINKWIMARKPKSTISGIGSWSVSSNGNLNSELPPPTKPFGAKNDQWDLIYEAVGHVATLKMSHNESNKNCKNKERELLGSVRSQIFYYSGKNQITGFYSSQSFGHSVSHLNHYKNQVRQDQELIKPHCSSVWGKQQIRAGWQAQPRHQNQIRGRSVPPLGLPQSAWPPLQVQPNLNHNQYQHQHNQQSHHSSSGTRAPFLCSSNNNTKRESSGTGVFLPRRYSNSNCKKKSGCPTVQVPAKVVQTPNLNLKDMNQQGHALNSAFVFDHDAMIARRNALLSKQNGNLVDHENVLNHHEISLPQEWIYGPN